MLAIVQQYKKLFTLLMVSEFASAEEFWSLPEEVTKLSVQQRNKDVLRRFLADNTGIFSDNTIGDNELGDTTTSRWKLLKALQSIARSEKVNGKELIAYFTEVLKLQDDVRSDIAELKGNIRVSQVDTSKLVEMTKWSDNKPAVAQLQQLLVSLWLLTVLEVWRNIGIYGSKTAEAVKILQEWYNSAKPTQWSKGVSLSVSGSIDVKTLTAIKEIQWNEVIGLVSHIKRKAPVDIQREVRTERVRNTWGDGFSEDWREVITDLRTIQRYLRAYNKTYGEKWSLLSNKMGVLWILNQLIGESDSQALARELGISEAYLESFANGLWIATGPNVMPWVKRFAIITALSLILTGGAWVAGELFWINISTKLHRGPNVDRILELLWRQWNFNEKYTKMLLSKKTTIRDIEGIFDVLNDDEMIPANLRRESEVMFDRNILSWLFDGLFGFLWHWKGYKQMQEYINAFNQSGNVEEGEFYLKQIYVLWLKELRKSRRNYNDAAKDLKYARSWWDNSNSEWQYEQRMRSEEKSIDQLELSLAWIWKEVTRISTLRALKERKSGFTDAQWRNRVQEQTMQIENELGGVGRPLKTISQDKLVSKGAYSLKIPSSVEALPNAYRMMKGAKIEGDNVSILANVMRSIKAHYGIDFSEAEFRQAFLGMRRVSQTERLTDFGNKVVSNTSRNNMQKFQGGFRRGELVELNINGSKVYLKDNCTNVVTVINDLPVTIESRTSVPFIIGTYIWGLTWTKASWVSTNPGWTDWAVDLWWLPGWNFPL